MECEKNMTEALTELNKAEAEAEDQQQPVLTRKQKKKLKDKQKKKAKAREKANGSKNEECKDEAKHIKLEGDIAEDISKSMEQLHVKKTKKRNRKKKKKTKCLDNVDVQYEVYESEAQIEDVMNLVDKDLSEPYSIFTYRFFLHQWPHLCFIARVEGIAIGTIVCKADYEHDGEYSGYIAMLVVDQDYRKLGLGSKLVTLAVEKMQLLGCTQVVLETEITNTKALGLYEKLGFARAERLFRYYLNGNDAFRLKLWFPRNA